MKYLKVAHRGCSKSYTENTLKAFSASYQAGSKATELDVRSTRDGKIVVFHDKTTGRLCPLDVSIEDTDYAELPRLNDGQEIPELETVLITAPQEIFFIEIKKIDDLDKLLKVMDCANEKTIVIISKDMGYLKELDRLSNKVDNDIKLGFVTNRHIVVPRQMRRIDSLEYIIVKKTTPLHLCSFLNRRLNYKTLVYTAKSGFEEKIIALSKPWGIISDC